MSNKNVFYATNPGRMIDALGRVLDSAGVELKNMLIFLPSRRAVRSVERYLVKRAGHSIVLPRLVALGEGADDADATDADEECMDAVSDTERVAVLAKLLAKDSLVGDVASGLPLAHDLLRMQDYLENEGAWDNNRDWTQLVDEKYANHFRHKAELLNLLSRVQAEIVDNRPTQAQVRNRDIRAWRGLLDKYGLIVVCGSTASVPATADLMVAVASHPRGRIILSGRISGDVADFELDTNPYNSEYKLLQRLGMAPGDVMPIDVGDSAIEFMNYAFGNNPERLGGGDAVAHCHLVACARESEEADVVAEIAHRAVVANKSVLVITPDAAGNQRIAVALGRRGIDADFSGGVPGNMTRAGRALLNLFDAWVDAGRGDDFDKIYAKSDYNLMRTIEYIVDDAGLDFSPGFDIDDVASIQVWRAIKKLSDCLEREKITLDLGDARAFLADAISRTQVRNVMKEDASVIVLGTIESRMQVADVVILTGLNDGMFPARGYENAWIPLRVAQEIGLPSPDRKVSLQSLDFMNLSCCGEVYWTRSEVSGGVKTTPSRFLSRVSVRGGAYDSDVGHDILRAVRERDNVVADPLDKSAPTPGPDWSKVYVTELEYLTHNPYAFYVRHILRLRVLDDYWVMPDARKLGNIVHKVIENTRDFDATRLVADMQVLAHEILAPDSVLFHFWRRRFDRMAPVIVDAMKNVPVTSKPELEGSVEIAGRRICAIADRVWDGGVLDIKTGAAPSRDKMIKGTMPQLPLEAYILQQGGFPIETTVASQTPQIMFVQLQNKNEKTIVYSVEDTRAMIDGCVEKTTELVNQYSVGQAPYEYYETQDSRYKIYDDLARQDD